jgi:hypothetical protein
VSAPAALLIGLFALSTGLRFGAARGFELPWIAPDEMLYALLGESLWRDGELSVRGTVGAYYSFLTPALVGAPIAAKGPAAGVELAQLLQTAAMSSVVFPVYLWCRRLVSPWWALAAAVVCVAGPALTYGGLLMTEALFVPMCAWALFAAAMVLERPSVLRQGVFLGAVTAAAAVRMQALVLLPAFALAAVLLVAVDRDRRRARALAPLTAGIGVAVLALLAVRLVHPETLGSGDVLGAYASVGESGSVERGGVASMGWQLAALALATLVVPLLALVLLAVETLGGRVVALPVRAFVATAVSYVALLVLQLAVFAGGRLDHVSERYLTSVGPLLAIALATWAGTGAPRRRGALLATALVAATLVAATPPRRLAPPDAVQDSLSFVPLLRLEGHDAIGRLLLVCLVLGAVTAVALVPRRHIAWLVAAVVAGLALASADATREVGRLSRDAGSATLGSAPRDWLDRTGVGPVTLLASGDRPQSADARELFWNTSVADVVRLPGVAVGVPPSPPVVRLDPATGVVAWQNGAPLVRHLVAAPETLTLRGSRVAQRPGTGGEVPRLVVWRVDGIVRVALQRIGFEPDGSVAGRATVVVPACRPGTLELTLLGRAGGTVDVTVNGLAGRSVTVPAATVLRLRVPAPDYADGRNTCVFGVRAADVGTTRIAFLPVTPASGS